MIETTTTTTKIVAPKVTRTTWYFTRVRTENGTIDLEVGVVLYGKQKETIKEKNDNEEEDD